MHAAMRRPAAPACAERIFREAECLTFAQALWMYTSGAAYCAGKERVFGLLQAGYSADFVVLSAHADVTPPPLSSSSSASSSSSSSQLSSSTASGGDLEQALASHATAAAAVGMFDAHPERLLQCRVEQVWIAGSQRL
jgi:predicted amidohydrolase YtcJ